MHPPPFVTVKVVNPQYEKVTIDCKVVLCENIQDERLVLRQLTVLTQNCIAPWLRTVEDYRRLFLAHIPDIDDVHITCDAATGGYTIRILPSPFSKEKTEKMCEAVKALYHRYRNLCEFLSGEVEVLKPEKLEFHAEFEITPGADATDVLARVYAAILDYLSGAVRISMPEGTAVSIVSPGDWLEGMTGVVRPVLSEGKRTEHELYKRLRVVKGIRSFTTCYLMKDGTPQTDLSQGFGLHIPERKTSCTCASTASTTSRRRTSPPSSNGWRYCTKAAGAGFPYRGERWKEYHWQIPEAAYRDIFAHDSVVGDFPSCYRLSETGGSGNSAFESYLSLYDRVIQEGLEEVWTLPRLLSLNAEDAGNPDNRNACEARKQYLDFLDRLYGVESNPAWLAGEDRYGETEEGTLRRRMNFLGHAAYLTRNRSRARDILPGEAGGGTPVPKEWFCHLLGLESSDDHAVGNVLPMYNLRIVERKRQRSLAERVDSLLMDERMLEEDMVEPIHYEELASDEAKKLDEYNEMRKELEYFNENRIGGDLFRGGTDLARYRTVQFGAGEYLLLYRNRERDGYTNLGRADNLERLNRMANILRRFLHELNRACETVYVLEPVLADTSRAFRLMLVFPDWTGRFHQPAFRAHCEELLRSLLPAHLAIDTYWLAVQTQGRIVTAVDAIRDLFATFWHANELPAVIKGICESIETREEAYLPEALLALIEEAGSGVNIRLSAFHEWNHRQETLSNTVQTAFKEYWNITDDLAKWLEDGTIPTDYKRELLQTAVTEHTQEWMALLRNTARTGKTLETLSGYLSVSALQQSMAKANFYQSSVLSRVVERIEHHADTFPFLTANGASLSSSLSKALLRYMQETDTLEHTLTEAEIIEKFLSVLYIIYKGETGSDYRDDNGWKQLAAKVMPEAERQETINPVKPEVTAMLSDRMLLDAELQDTVQSLVERHPDKLLSWLEEDAGSEEIYRIAEVANGTILERWVEYLPMVAGFMNASAFRRLTTWLLRSLSDKYSTVALATALFAWVKETDWRQQTPEQMEDYFFARLYGGSNGDIPLTVESLARTDLPESIRQRLLQHFIRFRPKELLAYIRRSTAKSSLPFVRWTEWLDTEDWEKLAASLFLSTTELLRQVAEVLHLDEQVQRQVWSVCLTTGNKEEEWAYNSPEENIRSFVQAVMSVQRQDEAEVETIVWRVKEELHLRERPVPVVDDVPELFPIGNAGLCLLYPWLPRLFGMLGYLDEEKKKLKDTVSKIRAVFLLQHLVYGEEREYRETELFLNRLLAGLSWHVPLPTCLSLTKEEKQVTYSMLSGVKANWT